MKPRHPDVEGTVTVDSVEIGYEVFGSGDPTILLLPTWTIIHARFWKMQIPYLARHYRVIAFDGPGNGRSTHSTNRDHYAIESRTREAIAVLDATATERAFLVSLSKGALWSLPLGSDHPDRVLGQVFIGPSIPLTPQFPDRATIPQTFMQVFDEPQGWEKYNAHYWLNNYSDFLEFFFSQCFIEPHSTKQLEDCVGWGMETDANVLLADANAEQITLDRETILNWCRRITHPVLVIQGAKDMISPISRGQALAEATGGALITLEGSGHIPLARDPVRVNLAIKDFVDRVAV